MIRIGHIDFINTLPFDWRVPDGDQTYSKFTGPPTRVNRLLLDRKVDVGVASLAFFLLHKADLVRIGDYGIISDGPVMSVVLFSKFDLSNWTKDGEMKLYETPESATSVILNRIILRRVYGVAPVFVPKISGAEAVLLIGNKALLERQRGRWVNQYDLGEEWKKLTGLPMVYAVLACHRKVFENKREELQGFLEFFKNNYRKSMKNRDSLVARAKEKTLLETGLLHRYFCGLKYEIGEEEEKSIALFERLLHQEKDFFAPHPPLKVGG